jgi:hypothetical protein
MVRSLLLVALAAVLLADGLVHGLWTDRWKVSEELPKAVARLNNVPLQIGDWESKSLDIDEKTVKQAGYSGYLLRRYENRRTGRAFNVLLSCGRPGPLSVHTPEICYQGAGFSQSGEITRTALDPTSPTKADELWMTKFSKADSTPPINVRVYWAWNATGAWQAPDNPRWNYARYPVLYKLYITYTLTRAGEAVDDAEASQFLSLLLDELNKDLFPGS